MLGILKKHKRLLSASLFSDYFTVYAIEVISNQSGVNRDANTNNGVIVDNYWGSSFYYG